MILKLMEEESDLLSIGGESHDRDQDLTGAEPDQEAHVEADLVPPEGADRIPVQETEVGLIPNHVHDHHQGPQTAAISAPELRNEQVLDLGHVQLRMNTPTEVTESFLKAGSWTAHCCLNYPLHTEGCWLLAYSKG